MKIPFFNLSGKVKLDDEDANDALIELNNLVKISTDNNKKIKEIILSRAVYHKISQYQQEMNKVFGYKYKIVPDVAVIWEKEKK